MICIEVIGIRGINLDWLEILIVFIANISIIEEGDETVNK